MTLAYANALTARHSQVFPSSASDGWRGIAAFPGRSPFPLSDMTRVAIETWVFHPLERQLALPLWVATSHSYDVWIHTPRRFNRHTGEQK